MKSLSSLSDIEIPVIHSEEPQGDDRKDFHVARNGKWSGTVVKELMQCNVKGGKLQWGDDSKITEFSSGILKLIYSKYKQRKTGKYVETGATNEMKYGTKVESLILEIGKRLIPDLEIEPVKFKAFPDNPNAGATSDSVGRKNGVVKATVEAKACTNWNTHYDRVYVLMDEKSKDFWQTQTQMIAWEVDICYYLVAEPPKNMGKYLYYDGDIMDLLEDFRAECEVSLQVVKASPIHQIAIKKRIYLAEKIVDMAFDTGKDIKECYSTVIDGKTDIVNDIEVVEPIKELPINDLPF